MPLPALILWADSGKNELVSGWQSTLDIPALTFKQGDKVGIELHWVQRSGFAGQNMTEILWPAQVNITMAIGRLDVRPAAGTFVLGYGTQYTTPLNATATAQQTQDALNNLSLIAAEGGVTVSFIGTTYRILWNVARVPAHTVTVYSNDLTPTCSIGIASAREGSATVKQITQMHIKQAPVAVCTQWADQDAPAVTVTQTHAPTYSGDYRIFRVVISPQPKEGTFRLSTTINGVTTWSQPINVSSLTASTITSAIGKAGVTATAISTWEYEISQVQVTGQNTVNVTAMTGDASGLIGFSSKFGTLSLNSLDVELLLAGQTSGAAIFEIEVEADGKRQTISQTTCTIFNDLIDTDSYTLQEWGDVIPADSVVRYDTSQALTTAQQNQARANIAALGASDVTSLTGSQNALEARVGVLESNSPTTDQGLALDNANAPTGTNPFATIADLASKADTVHTQAISTITNLQTVLDTKASITHTQSISSINDLQDALNNLDNGKSDTGHTHQIADIDFLQDSIDGKAAINHTHATLPSTSQKAALDAAYNPGADNRLITDSDLVARNPLSFAGETLNMYPDLYFRDFIAVNINGVQYMLSARKLS